MDFKDLAKHSFQISLSSLSPRTLPSFLNTFAPLRQILCICVRHIYGVQIETLCNLSPACYWIFDWGDGSCSTQNTSILGWPINLSRECPNSHCPMRTFYWYRLCCSGLERARGSSPASWRGQPASCHRRPHPSTSGHRNTVQYVNDLFCCAALWYSAKIMNLPNKITWVFISKWLASQYNIPTRIMAYGFILLICTLIQFIVCTHLAHTIPKPEHSSIFQTRTFAKNKCQNICQKQIHEAINQNTAASFTIHSKISVRNSMQHPDEKLGLKMNENRMRIPQIPQFPDITWSYISSLLHYWSETKHNPETWNVIRKTKESSRYHSVMYSGVRRVDVCNSWASP